MANNLLARYMKAPTPNVGKTNWAKDYLNITSADVGYGIPILCDEIIANSNVSFDLKAAVFTNPTVAPLYSKFKMQLTAWWCPMSAYVPALRDSVKTDATTDYSFPVINFDYDQVSLSVGEFPISYRGDSTDEATARKAARSIFGSEISYSPTSSIYHYLRMWPANYSPAQFADTAREAHPSPLNAIPLLMYYDIFRNYILNTQENYSYIRVSSYKPLPDNYYTFGEYISGPRPAKDKRVTREDFDNFFKAVLLRGMDYQQDSPYDISLEFGRHLWPLFPAKKIYFPHPDGSFVWDTYNTTLLNVVEDSIFIPDYHYGLWRDTYKNDFYTAFISDENVNYERDTARISVDSSVTGGELEFTMEQVRMASMIENFVRSHVFRNSSFDEYVDVEYGCKPQRNLTRPMFLGAVSSNLMFNDVINRAQTGNSTDIMDKQQLGSRAAIGEGHIFTGKYRDEEARAFIKFHAPEPGYFMVILTIKPDVAYFEGYDPMYDKHSLFDLYRPSLKQVGYQDKCYRHINMIPQLQLDPTGKEVNPYEVATLIGVTPEILFRNSRNFADHDYAYAHEPYGFEYMGKPNIITGQMSEPGTYLHWTNARSINNVFQMPYDLNEPSVFAQDPLSTTILPEMFHYIFANTDNVDNFQFYYDFDYNVYQPVPRKILSFD